MFKQRLYSLKVFLSGFFPHLYIEAMEYRLEGHCCQCGDCCKYILCPSPFALLNFHLIRLFFPKHKRFKIVDSDKFGNLILACKLIGDDGRCTDYENRLNFCKDFPGKTYSGGMLYERCTYKLIPLKSFESYLDKLKQKKN